MRESFVFYRSWFEAIEELPPKKAKELILAIGKLALEGEDITEEIQDKIVKLLFKAYKPNIKANVKKYEAGKKGAHSRWSDKEVADEKQANSTTDSKEIANDMVNKKQSDSNTDSNVNVNVNVKERENSQLAAKGGKRFKPPTLEEIQAYIDQRELNVDAKTFYDYFETGNWIDSTGKRVKNWKQKLLTWHSKNIPKEPAAKPLPDFVPANELKVVT